MKKLSSIAGLASVFILLGAGCGAPATPSSQTSATTPVHANPNAILIEDYTFKPATLTVKKGTIVTWTNKDIAKHTITGDAGGPKSELFGQRQTYGYTFDTVGTFPYHCEPHPYMKGTVEVVE